MRQVANPIRRNPQNLNNPVQVFLQGVVKGSRDYLLTTAPSKPRSPSMHRKVLGLVEVGFLTHLDCTTIVLLGTFQDNMFRSWNAQSIGDVPRLQQSTNDLWWSALQAWVILGWVFSDQTLGSNSEDVGCQLQGRHAASCKRCDFFHCNSAIWGGPTAAAAAVRSGLVAVVFWRVESIGS